MRNRKLIDLYGYVDEINTSQLHELSGHFKDQNGNIMTVSVLDNEMFKDYFEIFFNSYSMLIPENQKDVGVVNLFNILWKIFQNENQENLNKIVAGYYWDYVPVYNYDRTEEWTDVRTGSESDNRVIDETPTGATKVTTTPSGSYKDTTVNGATTRQDSEATMDSGNMVLTNESHVNSVTNENTHTFQGYQEVQRTDFEDYNNHTDDDNTHTYNEVTDTHKARLFGNIGVTTNVEMIEQEFNLRVHNLGYEFLKRFFDKFFVML